MRPTLKQYIDDTTVHGLKDIFESPNAPTALAWIAMILASTGAMVYETWQIVQGYLDRPKATQISQLFLDSYPYPIIMFCPRSWINASRMVDLILTKDELTYALSHLGMLRILDALENVNHTHTLLETKMRNHSWNSYMDTYEAVADDSEHTMTCSACKTWPATKKATEDGVCYQIHLNDARRFFLDDFTPYFTYNPGVFDKQLTSILPSYQPYFSSEQLYVGVLEKDFFAFDPIKLSHNNSYLLKISPQQVKRLNTDGQACFEPDYIQSENYSQKMCYSHCEQVVHGPACWQCVYLGYIDQSPSDPITNISVPLWSSLTYKEPKDWRRCQEDTAATYAECAKNCRPPCEEWQYDTTVMNVEGRKLVSQQKDEAAITVLINLQVKSGTMVVEEKATYTWHMCVSNVGGQLGLWLGISTLSLCQFVFFIFRWVESVLEERGHSQT